MRHQVLGRRHDRRDARLVVGAEQRRPRRRDDVVPDLRRELGLDRRRAGRPCGSSGSTMSRPSQARWTIGLTPSPGISGDVSTCAMNPIVRRGARRSSPGSSPSGSRCSSSVTSASPISRSSAASRCCSVSCPGVLGHVVELSSARVSTCTYRRKRSRTSCFVDDQEVAPADGFERVAVARELGCNCCEAVPQVSDDRLKPVALVSDPVAEQPRRKPALDARGPEPRGCRWAAASACRTRRGRGAEAAPCRRATTTRSGRSPTQARRDSSSGRMPSRVNNSTPSRSHAP